jgi:tetratricopeptide (TPR) repeat protein
MSTLGGGQAGGTSTRQPAATLTKTFVFLIPSELKPVTLPDQGVSNYHLRPWSENNCTALVNRITDGDFTTDPVVDKVAPYALALQSECLLRFPRSASRETMLWDTLNIDPRGLPLPGMRPGQSLFSFLLEDLYHRGEIHNQEELTKTLEADFRIEDSIQVTNLFGDGQEALVFTLSKHPVDYVGVCATLAIHQAGSQVRVETLRDWEECDWGMVTNYFTLPGAADTNGNGLPEVIVDEKTGMSGLPQHWGESIFLHEWEPASQAFSSTEFSIFFKDCDSGPCEGQYEIGALDANNTRPITVTEYWYTDGPPDYGGAKLEGSPKCPELEVRHTYRWNGKGYAAGDKEITPPQSDRPACRIAWADQVIYRFGWQNDPAIQILSEAVQNWPEAMNTLWGPASLDYLRLRLGIWHDLRGEASAALELLQSLADAPADPLYDLPSRMAAVYVAARAQAGIAGACLKTQQAWSAEGQAAYDEFTADRTEFGQLMEHWGFANPRWDLYMRWNIDDLCTPAEAIEAGVPGLWAASTTNLKNWLEIIGFQVLAVKPADLDGNGQTDWLALINTEQGRWSTNLWAFVQAPTGLKASLVDDSWGENYTDFTLRSYRPQRGAPLVNLVQAGDNLSIFYIDAINTTVELGWENSALGQWVDERPEGSLLYVYTQSRDQQSDVKTYTWNAASQSLEEHSLSYDFAAAETEAERLLFQAQDYAAAIDYINKFLRDAPPEPLNYHSCDQWGCDYFPEWYFPYMRYLLAVAYEMDGQPDMAVEGYFRLWQDYPAHIFGMAAQLKLQPFAP